MSNEDKIAPKPLVADIARQAIGLFKGVDYQTWLTALAWIDLAEQEILVIEGAEDFDVVTTEAGLSVQVKALADPISLRSESVVSAVQHFWQHKHANHPRAIRFRFVTTAEAAVEAGSPFGNDIAGLKLWNECAAARDVNTAEAIRQFLLNDPSVRQRLKTSPPSTVPALIEFLRTTSAEQVLRQIIIPVTWDLRGGGIETAREAVRIRLHAYGELKGLSIQDSDRALSPLFEYVAHKAIGEKRALSREDFRVVFDNVTRESVPKTELAVLRMLSLQVMHGLPAMVMATTAWDTGFETTLPPLPVPCCPRTTLVSDLTSTLLRNRFLALSGSTGTGKSTLAKLIAARTGQAWLWVNCGGRNAALVEFRLRQLAKELPQSTEPVSVVFDNFTFDATELTGRSRSLAATILLVLRTGGCVAVTSQRSLPELFRRALPFSDDAFKSVPALHEDEVEEFCALAGCSDHGQRKLWSRIIWLQAQGHPQLTHARVAVAARRGWPAADPAELLQTPEDIKEERALARQLLRDLDDGQRELLYRLSIASRPFRRDHAVAAGEIAPAVPHAGDSFDALVGPWIERRGAEYFRLSPLLTGAGEANWSADHTREMRAAYGRAVMRCGNATLLEAGEALFQVLLAQDDQLAGPILVRLLLAPRKRLPSVASELDWLFYFTGNQPVFPKNRFVNLVLRQVQFRLAAAVQHRQAANLAEILYRESQQSFDAKLDDLLRDSCAIEILVAVKVRIRPATLLRCWLDADQLARSSPDVKKFARKIERGRGKKLGLIAGGFSETLFTFILAREADATFFNDFVAAVDALQSAERSRLFEAIRAHESLLQLFLDKLWTSELEKPVRDWDAVLKVLSHARAVGARWNMSEMVIAAARGMAAVQDEYLNQSSIALETLKSAAQEAGRDGLMLRYQRGTIFSRQGRFREAYDAWVSTLEHWPSEDFEGSVQSLLAHSNCGSAAGQFENWTEAARIFQRGREIAQKTRRMLEATEFGTDAAYSLWRAAKRADAVAQFAACLEELERLAGRKEPVGFHTLWKLVEQIIRWCAQEAGAPQLTPIATPRSGACSEPRERAQHEALQKYPRGPLLFSWYSLAEAELGARLGNLAFGKLTSRTDTSKYPWLESLIAYLKMRKAFVNSDFDELVLLVEKTAEATARANANPVEAPAMLAPHESPKQVDDYTSEVAGWAPEAFASALIILVATGKDVLPEIENWKRSAPEAKSKFDYRGLLDDATQLLSSDPRSAYRAYSTRPNSRFQQIVSALRMGTDADSSLAACFVGLVSLITDEPLAEGRLDVRRALGTLVKRVWEQRIRFSAEFNSPRVSIPAIKVACEAPYDGLRLAAHILLAARSAVSVRALDSSIRQLRLLAGD